MRYQTDVIASPKGVAISKLFFFLITLLILGGIIFPQNLFSHWEWTPKTNRWINPKYSVKDTAAEQFAWAESFAKKGKIDIAIKKHEQLIEHFPISSYAAASQYRIGELYLEKGDNLRAFWALQKVIEDYPQTKFIGKVVTKEFEIANSLFEGKRRRFAKIPIPGSVKTAELFEKIVENEPFGKYAAESQYKSGLSYLKEKNPEGAKEAFQKVGDNYPKSKWAEKASYRLILFSSRKKQKIARDQSYLSETVDQCKEFKSIYSESEKEKEIDTIIDSAHQKEAEKLFSIGLFYEKKKEKKAATIYYQKIIRLYPQTEIAKSAEEKLKKLK